MEILVENFFKNGNFGRKRKFRSKIKPLLKNRNLGRKKKIFFWPKIKTLLKNRNLGRKKFLFADSKLWRNNFFLKKIENENLMKY